MFQQLWEPCTLPMLTELIGLCGPLSHPLICSAILSFSLVILEHQPVRGPELVLGIGWWTRVGRGPALWEPMA